MPPGEFRIQFDSDQGRVRRGGSWSNTAGLARAADRSRFYPGLGVNFLGFRLCRDADYPKHTQRSDHAQEV